MLINIRKSLSFICNIDKLIINKFLAAMVTNEMPLTTIPNAFANAVAATTADIPDYPTDTMILVAYQAAVHTSVAMVDPLVTI